MIAHDVSLLDLGVDVLMHKHVNVLGVGVLPRVSEEIKLIGRYVAVGPESVSGLVSASVVVKVRVKEHEQRITCSYRARRGRDLRDLAELILGKIIAIVISDNRVSGDPVRANEIHNYFNHLRRVFNATAAVGGVSETKHVFYALCLENIHNALYLTDRKRRTARFTRNNVKGRVRICEYSNLNFRHNVFLRQISNSAYTGQ